MSQQPTKPNPSEVWGEHWARRRRMKEIVLKLRKEWGPRKDQLDSQPVRQKLVE